MPWIRAVVLYSISTWLAIAFSGLLSPSASATSLPTKKVSGFVGTVANRDGALNRGDCVWTGGHSGQGHFGHFRFRKRGYLLTIYKYKYLYYSDGFWQLIFRFWPFWPWPFWPAPKLSRKTRDFIPKEFVNRNANVVSLHRQFERRNIRAHEKKNTGPRGRRNFDRNTTLGECKNLKIKEFKN